MISCDCQNCIYVQIVACDGPNPYPLALKHISGEVIPGISAGLECTRYPVWVRVHPEHYCGELCLKEVDDGEDG